MSVTLSIPSANHFSTGRVTASAGTLNASVGSRSAPIVLRPYRVIGSDHRPIRADLSALWGIQATAHIRQDRRPRTRRAKYQMGRALPREPIRLLIRCIYRDSHCRRTFLPI